MVMEDLAIGARIILKWSSDIYIYMMGGCRLDSSGSGQGQVVGSCNYRNKLPGSKIPGKL